jgi:voltage-gated potassium channel
VSRSERRWVEAAIVYVSVAATAVAFVLALCVWLVDDEAFSSFGEAIWWAIVTVSTVGYGDVIPENGAGRAVAALLIVFSMAFFPVLTGLVTAALISVRDRSKEDDAERQASARQEELVEQLRSIDDRLRRIEDSL